MKWLRSLCSRLFRRKIEWNALDYGKPATVEDELAELNNES
jgi:hypothetical protein